MDTKHIPSDVWRDLDRIRRTNEEIDKRFVGYHSDFYNKLVDFGYIEIDEVDDRYNFYKALPKFSDTLDAKILEEICGKSIKEIMASRVIEAEDVPDDLEELIESLDDADGYFCKVDIYNDALSKVLRFHGFTNGAGPHSTQSVGTDKLEKYSIEKVIETITGTSYKSFLDAKANSEKGKEIALMKELATKHGYEVMLVDDYIELMN
jgi:hypothetical protein